LEGVPINSIVKPDQRALETGPAKTELPNPLDKEGDRMRLIADTASKVANGYEMTPQEARTVGTALAMQFGLKNKLQADAVGNIVLFKNFQENELPGIFNVLAGKINENLATPAPQPPPPAPVATPAGMVTPQPAPPPPPIVPLGATNPPPIQTTVLSAAPSSHEQQVTAAAVTRAQLARQSLEQQIGIKDGKMPATPYVPNLLAAIVAEKNGGMVGNTAIAQIDPRAPHRVQQSGPRSMPTTPESLFPTRPIPRLRSQPRSIACGSGSRSRPAHRTPTRRLRCWRKPPAVTL
jgi:hypothetical protein